MARQFFPVLLLFTFLPAFLPPPAHGYEVYKEWQRQRERRRRQTYTPPSTNHQYNEPGVQEVHGATSRDQCRKMAQQFQQQGRRVRLVDIIPSTNPGAVLRFNCVFEGEDAQTGWYDEKRY